MGAVRDRDGARSVTIRSLAGVPCVLANPWPGIEPKVACVETSENTSASRDEGLLRFETCPGKTYTIMQ